MQRQDFSQFIEFGQMFDRPTREMLVDYLLQKVQAPSQNPSKAAPARTEAAYLQKALDKIFEHSGLLKATQQHERLAEQVIGDVLKWMRKTYEKIQKDSPYQDEIDELNRWAGKPAFLWVRSWYHLTNFLKEHYTVAEIDISFYELKFEQLLAPVDAYALERKEKEYTEELAALEILIEDLLAQWRALLTAKRLQYELEQIDKQRELFCEMLYAKVEELLKLLQIISPFANEVGRLWDMSSGKWQEVGFELLQQYAEILQNEQSIQELADMLGKMREAEIETEEELYENIIVKKAWVDDFDKKSEIGGIHTDNHLPNVLPSEMAFLGLPETESVFLKKYADKALLSFRYQGKSLVTSDQVNHIRQQRIKRKEKGPFIICIDTSGSMEGLPERIAKTLCFAILKMAAKEQRKAYLINFSIGIKTLNLLDLSQSMEMLLKFLSMSFYGGTDVSPALIEALQMLQSNDYKQADVLVVSDFVMFDIREDVLKKIRQEQQKDTKFHSLTISNYPNPDIIRSFDNNWRYDPESREVIRQLWKDLQSLQEYA